MIETVGGWASDGGPIVVILFLVSLYSLTLIGMKVFQLSGALAGAKRREAALERWRAGDTRGARATIGVGRSPADRIAAFAMEALEQRRDRAALEAELERMGMEEVERMSRHLRMLEVIAMVSPLMGLLGTVLGMIAAFQQLELAEGSANASVLAGGIWQALLTTAVGLIVAIPAAIAANLFAARVDRAAHQIENTVARLYAAERARGR